MTKANKQLAARLRQIAEERLSLLWDEERFAERVKEARTRWGVTEREAVIDAAEYQIRKHTEMVCDAAHEEERFAIREIHEAAERRAAK